MLSNKTNYKFLEIIGSQSLRRFIEWNGFDLRLRHSLRFGWHEHFKVCFLLVQFVLKRNQFNNYVHKYKGDYYETFYLLLLMYLFMMWRNLSPFLNSTISVNWTKMNLIYSYIFDYQCKDELKSFHFPNLYSYLI